ncbi:GDSL-type esterase/lipase family protein [Aphanothece sacrum]|uniref:Lipase n=1 Tax=Aphanothece sacrum FPU1 TaxID=1920663 RepID=A0A401IBY0_APHSA|nr:GDSL-type esterase/lipase family protein [Aphanothece sacrum]GBF78788.1 lipase [Aphanothece sacrum FPU1]GBF83020.1 lipase [Aphanothece sacrum FPU3]
MITQNKILLSLSLAFNLIFICLTIIFIVRKGGFSYISKKLEFLMSFNQSAELLFNRNNRRNSYQTSYYTAKNKIFKQLPNSDQEIILVGDSLTDQGEWSEILQNYNVINRGISGDTTDGILNRIDEIIDAKPRKLFIMIGTNDIWNEQKTVDEVILNYQEILDIIKTKSPQTSVYIQSILPVNNINYSLSIDSNDLSPINDKLKKLAQEFNYQYIDLYSNFIDTSNQLNSNYTYDGVHLNGKGYLLWGNLIKKYVEK